MLSFVSSMTERRASVPGLWSQRLSLFLMLYFIVIIAGYRWRIIDTPSLFVLLGLGIVMLMIALVLGGIGLYQLWHYGHIGGRRSVRGIVFAAIMAIPYAVFGWLTIKYPPLHDITTDLTTPPAYEEALKGRLVGMNPIDDLGVHELEKQLEAYPEIGPRRFETSADRVFSAVTKLMESRDWRIVAEDIPEIVDLIDIEGSARKNARLALTTIPVRRPAKIPPSPQKDAAIEIDTATGDELNITYIEAEARSLIFGFPSDVVIRIVEEEDATLVDMRSSSRWGPHDLGSNAAQIKAFLKALDLALIGVAGDTLSDAF